MFHSVLILRPELSGIQHLLGVVVRFWEVDSTTLSGQIILQKARGGWKSSFTWRWIRASLGTHQFEVLSTVPAGPSPAGPRRGLQCLSIEHLYVQRKQWHVQRTEWGLYCTQWYVLHFGVPNVLYSMTDIYSVHTCRYSEWLSLYLICFLY